MQGDIQKACTSSSGNVNQHSPVSLNRVPYFWAAASSPPLASLALPWGCVSHGSHILRGVVSMAAGLREAPGSSPGPAVSGVPLRHSPSCIANAGPRRAGWGNQPRQTITCWKITLISSQSSSLAKGAQSKHSNCCSGRGGGRCMHRNQQLESGGGLGLALKKSILI